MKISLCMIVKNEEEVLARCLNSCSSLVDEIVLVDTGSTDKTVQIAQEFSCKTFSFPWVDDFAKARNFSFAQATGDYLLWLDADDIIPPDQHPAFAQAREILEKEQPDILSCPYDVAFADGKPTTTFYRERFIRRESNFLWQGRVHECIAPRGKILKSQLRIAHLSSSKNRERRNLHIYEKWAGEEKLSCRDLFYYGRELYYHKLYTQAIAILREAIDGQGWYVNQIEACKTLALCYLAQNKWKNALSALLESFRFGQPRATALCEIAKIFQAQKRFSEAIYWYEQALSCPDHTAEGDFEDANAHTLIPLLELVCCYYAVGNHARAIVYHKKTEELFPTHPSVVYNRRFFHEFQQNTP